MQTNPESISLRGVGSETCKRQKRVKAETAPGTDDESDQVLENRIAFHTSEAARLQSILDTVRSSGVPQPAASCHEPRAPMVFMKSIEPIWASAIADGQKMFYCVANNMEWQNEFAQLSSGDIFIVVWKGRGHVSAVCEVASPAIVKETNRDVLKGKLQESRHAAFDAYLDGAESFDYVEFKHVFDCRFFLPVSGAGNLLERVGLASQPGFGLRRLVVIDAQWHIRLREYMQQAVMRGPVDVLAVSRQEMLMLELPPGQYDAIISRRQRWVMRPIFRHDIRPFYEGCGQFTEKLISYEDELATVGRQVILQKGPGTGRILLAWHRTCHRSLWRITEVRRYTSVEEASADLLPGYRRRAGFISWLAPYVAVCLEELVDTAFSSDGRREADDYRRDVERARKDRTEH